MLKVTQNTKNKQLAHYMGSLITHFIVHIYLHIRQQESRAVTGKSRDAAVNFDRYGVSGSRLLRLPLS